MRWPAWRSPPHVELLASGVLRIQAKLTNTASDDYWLDDLTITLPLPVHATEVITFHGRWCREFQPHRQTTPVGAIEMANRSGRTSHEHPPLVWAGSAGFGEQHGHVWGAHLAWSGPDPLRIPELDAQQTYALTEVLLGGRPRLGDGPLAQLNGAQWAANGLQLPAMHPETAIVLHLQAIS